MTLELLIVPINYSSWSVRSWLVMRHFDIPVEETVIPVTEMPWNKDTKDVVLSWSAAGFVPVLRDGNVTVWESLAIMEYLAEYAPDKPLWPKDRAARAKARSASAEMHASFTALRGECPMNARRVYEDFALSDGVRADIARICDLWRDCLAESGGPFLFGDFCIADAMYAPIVSRFETYGVELDDVCRAYSDALFALPAVQDWYAVTKAETWVIDKYELD